MLGFSVIQIVYISWEKEKMLSGPLLSFHITYCITENLVGKNVANLPISSIWQKRLASYNRSAKMVLVVLVWWITDNLPNLAIFPSPIFLLYMVYYPWKDRQTDTQILYTLLYKVNNRVTTCRLSRCSSVLEEWQTTSASHYPQHIQWTEWILSYSIHNFTNTLHLTLALHR